MANQVVVLFVCIPAAASWADSRPQHHGHPSLPLPLPLHQLAQSGLVGSSSTGTASSGSAGSSLRAVETAWANVRDTRFAGGAIGDGLHDDTAAIQAALSASQLVTVPPGRYRVTQTLHGQAGQVILGVTPERCIFTRNTTYGHTLSIGTNMSHAGSIVSCEPQILALGISLSLCCHCCLAPCLTGSCCEFLLKWPLFQ